jgi:hypothetical protein
MALRRGLDRQMLWLRGEGIRARREGEFRGGLGQSKVRAATEAATLDGGRACPGDLGPQQRCMRHQTNVASWPRPGKVASAAGTGGTGGEDG